MGTKDSVGQVDIFGHLGGFISGLFFGLIVMVRFRADHANRNGSYEKKVGYVGIFTSVVFFTLCFSLFYTVRDPAKRYY